MQGSNNVIICSNQEVVLRELVDSDMKLLAAYANNRKVNMNVRDAFPYPYSIDDAKRFKKMVDNQDPKTIFAIEFNGSYVGNISLSIGEDVYRKGAEIGYFIGEPFWNKGIATKAVKLMMAFGFENLDIVRISAGVFEFNKSSQRVLEKCGFENEGVSQKAICKNGKMYDEIRYAILKPD